MVIPDGPRERTIAFYSQSDDAETIYGETVLARSVGFPSDRRRRFGLSPTAAVAIAALGLALAFGLENNLLVFGVREQPTRSSAEAVESLLQRLMRSHVAQRLEREHFLNGSPAEQRATVDDELARLREHPLYVTISEMMTKHLQNEAYDRVPIIRTQDPHVFMLARDVEIGLNKFMHSVRAAFPAPNDKVAAYLRDQEEIFGRSIVAHRGGKRHDASFHFMIKLVSLFPGDLESVAGAVTFDSRHGEEIENPVPGQYR
jgi:hypothetical protein